MRIRTIVTALAVAISLAPASHAEVTPAPAPAIDLGTAPATFGANDLDAAVAAYHAHLERGAAYAAAHGHGTIVVPTREDLRRELAPAFAIAAGGDDAPTRDPVEDLLDESRDTQETTEFTAVDVAAHCSATIYAYGSKIWGIPVYRHVYLEGVHSCSGGFVLACLTTAVVPSNQPLMVGLGLGGGSGGCFNRTNKSGFTSKPTLVIGASLIVYTDQYGVGLIPFAFLTR